MALGGETMCVITDNVVDDETVITMITQETERVDTTATTRRIWISWMSSATSFPESPMA
jgi:hypothetical protein